VTEGKGKISVLVIPEQKYTQHLLGILKTLSERYKLICYVSMNKPCNSLLDLMKENVIDTSKFYFIDCITKTAKIPEQVNYCTYISSPSALTEISLAVSNYFMNEAGADCFIFDSLSTLYVHESESTITKFVHYLMAKLKVVGCDSYFTVLKTDENSTLMKDVHMFADQIVDISKWG
jgi:archaellum biogenesis ATPase FlaH